jgi:spoIIIJ-associated protein
MAREVERHAATVQEATELALIELGVGETDVRVEVIQEPKGGFLGVGGQEAIVRVRVHAPAVDLDELEVQADAVADFIDELLARMDIDALAEPNLQGEHMYVDIVDGSDDDSALLIGRHGQTLEAIQELARMAVGRRLDQRVRVIVDVQDYRKRREAKLVEQAVAMAEKVATTGREEELDPMNAYERKLVHDAVAEVPGVETSSQGEEPNRRVVIRRV